MPKPLVIVESPAKAKTIAGFLGREYLVEASIGHIRDLPNGSAEIPEAYKSERWARLGVDVDNDFKPLYVVPKKKKDQVRKLKGLVKEASEVYLATDEDREGESIAWHLLEVLNPQVPVKRMVFHEITRPAIERAVREWRQLDRRLVDAQEARRILDRLYGYEVSAVLWKKVMNGLSAGRVQSVATRLLVERERARIRHTSASYWDVEGQFEKGGKGERFGATLVSLDHRRLATGKDFGEDGRLTTGHAGAAVPLVLDEAGATGVATRLGGADFSVRSVEEKPYRRSPYPPFMTSTLQQEAGRKLRFPSQRTMRVAQDLYEQGYITYMRTDSTTLSDQALTAARAQARSLYGPAYVPEQPRRYDKKVKNAQEAHEAIRPSGETFRTPEQTRLSGDMFRLYDLIWKRTVASQMADARGQSMQVRLGAMSSSGEDAEFACSGKTIEFPGFLRAYVEGSDDPDAALEDQEVRLPIMAVGDALSASSLEPKGHATQPPARYTEASLVKAMEELGVGRPSTYAQIIENIQARGYVWKRGAALIPSWTAFAVVGLLEQHFGQLVDYGFTAQMEEDLDGIANGQGEAIPYLQRFYFGDVGGSGPAGDSNAAAGASGGAGAAGGAGAVAAAGGRAGASRGAGAAGPAGASGGAGAMGGAAGGAGAAGRAGAAGGPAGAGASDVAGAVGGAGAAGGGNGSGGRGTAGGAGRGNGSGGTGTPGGGGHGFQAGLKEMVNDQLAQIDAREVNSIPVGAGIVVRVGKYGPYIQRGEDRGQVPEDLPPDELTVERAEELLGAGSNDRVIGVDPASGLPVLARAGRFGPYVQLGGSDGGNGASASASASAAAGKPKTQSLLEGITLDSVTLDEALRLLSLPRLVGVDGDGEEIVATHGRYGPYLKKGADSRSLQNDGQLFTVSLDEARALFAQPKPGRATRSGASLRELGADPVSGQAVSVKDGRFGPYVTDGVTNASLRKGDSVEEVTLERAAELLVARREAAPRPPRKAAGAPATKKAAGAAVAKKAPAAKKAAGAAVAKKAPAAKKAPVAKKAAVKKVAAKKVVAKRAPAAAKKARGTS